MEFFNGKIHYLKIVTAVNIILGMLILVSLVFFARSIVTAVPKKNVKPGSSFAQRAIRPVNESFQEYETLLRENPFNVSAVSAKDASAGADEAVISDLKLMGTIAGHTRRGYAVLVGKDGKQAMFKTGESVFGAGELTAVEKYHVSIIRNGKLIKIPMVDMVVPGEIDSLKGGGASGPVRSLGKGEYIIDQKAIQHALDNPTQIMMDAKLIPNMTNGKQEGFVLREVRKSGIYDNLGMQNGDVLLRINGSGISNPENALQAFTALQGMDKIQLDIIRDKNRMVMNYQIR
jgi:general secretion pathway protein C